jgi:23S rRNA pseudouridine1911/1915/1917 synthase
MAATLDNAAAGVGGEPLAPAVLFEDEWLLAAEKPAGIIVHADGTGAATLTDLVRERLLAAGEAQAAAELQAVQRLDRETSGVVLFSKSKDVQPKLDALVAAHDGIEKRYLAIVRGEFPEGERHITAAIARDRHDARRMRQGAHGKPAETRVRRLATAGGRGKRVSLVECVLKTGRKHQIRVHLAGLGFPILGDALYGVPADRAGNAALMLHAASETFAHPVTGERVSVVAAYPQRFCPYFPQK